LVKLGAKMENYSSVVLATAMVAAFLLMAGGVKLALDCQTRVRGVLMIVAALVIVTNVMIWTV
jgi:high-affinity Fe2+/Pb2+ permease